MKKNYRVWFALAAGVFTGFLLLVILFQLIGFTWKDSIIFESCQGDYVKY